MIIQPIAVNWENATENLLTTGTIKGLSGTFTGLTPTHVVFAGTGGLLSGSADLIWSGTALTTAGRFNANGNADSEGIGTNVSYTKSDQSALVGINPSAISTKNSSSSYIYAVNFSASWSPSFSGTGLAKSMTALEGGLASLSLIINSAETKNFTIADAKGFDSRITITSATSAAGVAKVTTLKHFICDTPILNTNSIITTAYAFFDAGQAATGVATAWGCAINTQSYFNGNVAIGKNTTPAVPLDVVGAILNTTTIEAGTGFKCGGTAAVADGTYTVGARLTPVTGIDGTITTKGGIITAIQPAT